ncbi:hypothetical protein LJC72_10290 [Bacteroides sp. OttesenSCG-928-D19]|nr:hypothetical protein [Bacteroides sp. OttesenSCG-928-D19]
MGMFSVRKPRRFNHQYIYVDERKEKLAKMEEQARQELGMAPPREIKPENIRGKFVEGTTHLKRRKERSSKSLSAGLIIVIIVLLIFFWHYLVTGSWSF